MIRFNPFEKDISKIEKNDLNKLIDNKISEGWFVEYKEKLISSHKLAAAIAAFANSDGGWLIFGIKDDRNNVANEICGIDLKKYRQPKEQIRDIIYSNINPVPRFNTQLVNLAPNRAVVIVAINKGMDTPYMTKDGKIYRRISEGKDPIPETDRYALQKLFERSFELKSYIEDNSESTLYTSKNLYSKFPFLEIYMYPDSLNSYEFPNFDTMEFFNNLKMHFSKPVIINEKKVAPNLKLDNIYSSFNSYIVKSMVKHDDLLSLKTTVELQKNGVAKLIIPIKAMKRSGKRYFPMAFIENGQIWKQFTSILEQYDTRGVKIVDGFNFLIYLTLIIKLYFSLLRDYGFDNSIGVRIKTNNINGSLLFFNSSKYINFVNNSKLPIGIKKNLEMPRFGNGDLLKFGINDQSVYQIINTIYSSLGISSFVLDDIINDFPAYLSNYLIFKNRG